MTAKEVIRKLLADGWYKLPGKQTSHRHFKHPAKPGKVTVPMHPGNLPPLTLKSIAKQAGIIL